MWFEGECGIEVAGGDEETVMLWVDILKWIQSQFHQVAIFNAASNKISELETMKAGK